MAQSIYYLGRSIAPLYIHMDPIIARGITVAFYIVLTMVLILAGKYLGKMAYTWYWNIDPAAYRPTCAQDAAAADQVSLSQAQDAGRLVGAWLGFLAGAALTACALKSQM